MYLFLRIELENSQALLNMLVTMDADGPKDCPIPSCRLLPQVASD